MELPQVLDWHYDVFHISLLKAYVAGGEGIKIPQTIKVEGELEWEVERILHHKKKCNSSAMQYLIKYLGYDICDAIFLD